MDRKKWGGPSQEGLKKAYADRGKYENNSSYKDIFSDVGSKFVWKVEDKSHKVRLLPTLPADNINAYGMTIHVHSQVGANDDKYLCPKRMLKLNCPVCEHQTELWDADPEMAKGLYPTMRYLVWMVDLTATPDKQTTKLWSCPKGAMDSILGISYKKSTDEIINLSHVDKGIPIYFDREKVQSSNYSQYKNFQLDDEPLPAKDEWLDSIISFQDVIVVESYETIKNAFFGIVTQEPAKKEVEDSPSTFDRFSGRKAPQNCADDTIMSANSAEDSPPECAEFDSVETMDRDSLEEYANKLLSDEYEESEISDMGSKKLKRLVTEALEKSRIDLPFDMPVDKKEEPTDDIINKEALRRKLKGYVNNG